MASVRRQGYTVTFLTENHHISTVYSSTKVLCLVTEAGVRERLVQSRVVSTAQWVRVKPATSRESAGYGATKRQTVINIIKKYAIQCNNVLNHDQS